MYVHSIRYIRNRETLYHLLGTSISHTVSVDNIQHIQYPHPLTLICYFDHWIVLCGIPIGLDIQYISLPYEVYDKLPIAIVDMFSNVILEDMV